MREERSFEDLERERKYDMSLFFGADSILYYLFFFAGSCATRVYGVSMRLQG